MEKKTGWTKENGWQFGIRRSVPLSLEEVWDFLFSSEGAVLWNKDIVDNYTTYRHLSHIRTKWQRDGWPNRAVLQMRVISHRDKTTIAFHIDKLVDESQREEAGKYWQEIMMQLLQKLKDWPTLKVDTSKNIN